MIGHCMICTVTCGNGAMTVGMTTIKTRQRMEVVGMRIILNLVVGYYVAVLGSIVRGVAALPVVTTTLSAASTSVFESFPPRIPSPLLFCPLALCQPNAAKGGSIFSVGVWSLNPPKSPIISPILLKSLP